MPPGPLRERPTPLPRNVWALGVVSLFTDVGGDMVFPLLPRLLAGMTGPGAAAVGVVEGVADAVSHLVKPWVGARSDRMRRRKPYVLAGYGLSGVVRPLLAFAGHFGVALGVRSLDRLGKGIRSAPRDALIASSTPRERQARAFSLHRAMDHAGAVIGGSLAAGLLWTGLELREVVLLSAVPGVLAFLTLLFFVREPEGDGGAGADAVPAKPLTGIAAAETVEEAAPANGGDAAPLPRRLRQYFVILFVFALANSTDALLLLRIGDMGLSSSEVAAAWVVLHVVKVAASVPGGALADRVGPVWTIIAGWVLYAVLYAGFAFLAGDAAAWGLFSAYGLYYALTEGAEKAIVARLAPGEARGRAFGAMAFAMGLGTLLASVGVGVLYRWAGPAWAFGSGAAAALVAATALAVWARRDERAR